MTRLYAELRRRNVFRVAGVYTVVGWVLAQVATTLEETLGLPEWFDSLIVALLLIGLPVALVLAWAFELTPEGVVRAEDVSLDESITADTGRKLDIAIVLGLVLLVGMMAWQGLRDETEPRSAAPIADSDAGAGAGSASIAVLPFDDLSPEGDQEYFSDGIAEEILNVLVRVSGLDVASRTSAFQFKGAEVGIPEIAAALKVRHVVEGSVRKSGNTIRVTAQLIDSVNDRHLWSDTYDRPLTADNIFAIQDEIANAIVDALSGALGVGDIASVQVQSTTHNLDAYELYLRARPLFHDRIDLDTADQLLERAVELDPNFAQAWETRAALQILMRGYGYSDISVDEAKLNATEFATHALELEPASATAIALLAFIKSSDVRFLEARHDISEILSDFTRALDIEPRNASALNWRGLAYVFVGRLESALADFESCVNYEPYYRPCVENRYAILGAMGSDDASIAAYVQALNISSAKIEFAYLPSLARTGDELAFKMATNSPNMLAGWRRHDELWEAYRDTAADHRDLIESIRQYLAQHSHGYTEMFALIAHPIGTAWRTPEPLVLWDPMLHDYRQSAEFKYFIRESGVYEYWTDAGFPPQCRPRGTDDFECD